MEKKITKSHLNHWSIERRFDIAEGYLCSFERKPGRLDSKEEGYGLEREGERREGSLRGNGRRSREPKGMGRIEQHSRRKRRRNREKEGARRGLTLTIHSLFGGDARGC